MSKLRGSLLCNYLELLLRPHTSSRLRPTGAGVTAHHSWRLTEGADGLIFSDPTLERLPHPIASRYECERQARVDLGTRDVRFHDHPSLSRLVQLHQGEGWRPKRSKCKAVVTASRAREGKDDRDQAITSLATHNRDLHSAMAQLEWSDIRAVTGASAATVQTLFRIKANKLNLWNYLHNDRSCPHSMHQRGEPATLQHVFWECPIATAAWEDFSARWRRLGDNVTENLMEPCFSLDLPDTPRHAWQAVHDHFDAADDAHRDVLFEVSWSLWRLTAATTIHAIWCARLRLRHEPEAERSTLRAVVNATADNALRDFVLLTYEHDTDEHAAPKRAVTAALAARLMKPTAEPARAQPLADRSLYLLFFDGGSRGNPGPGGSGSVIVRVDTDSHAAEICWASSMSCAQPDTTNNTAEYWGLIHGLRRAEIDCLAPLHVVGDSAMIIQQQRQHRPPRQHRLRQLYLKARRCADGMGIRSWPHHYPEHNKMADKAANVAMDSRVSQQTSATENRSIISDLNQHLHNDVQQWLLSAASRNAGQRDAGQNAIYPHAPRPGEPASRAG